MSQRPSLSSVKLARGIVLAGRNPRFAELVPEGTAEWAEKLLFAIGLLRPWMIRLFEARWYQRFVAFVIRHSNPGQLAHVCLRKRFFEDECRAAIAGGARQLLSVGAGLDSLFCKLATGYPDVIFVEIDLPGTMAAKQRGLDELEAALPNLHLVAADLSKQGCRQVLEQVADWDFGQKSAVVAEGLLMYLPPGAVADFFDSMCEFTGAGSDVVFSYLRADTRGRPDFGKRGWLVRTIVKLAGSPFRWAIEQTELRPFLQRHGFDLQSDQHRCDLQTRYLVPMEREDLRYPMFESMAIARRQM